MREFFEFIFRLSWEIPLLALKQVANLFAPALTPPQPAPVTAGPGAPLVAASSASIPNSNAPSRPEAPSSRSQVSSGRLNTSRFVVLGEGLAAGVDDFSLNTDSQVWSFPAQMARQMGADFSQRLIQAPGIGNFVGYASLPVRVPAPMQSTVVEQLPPQPVSNLSVPEFRLEDSLALRPAQPLINRNNAKQTAVNLVWGLLPIAQGQRSLPTQVECALEQSPTFVVVELGYYEALEAAINGSPDRLPSSDQFISRYSEILSKLKHSGAEILVLNIPNPLDTAYFSSLDVAARIIKVEPSFLSQRYGINADDLITANGLNEISFQILGKSLQALPP